MNNPLATLVLFFSLSLMFAGPSARAGDDESEEAELAEATIALKEAALRLAELQAKRYDGGKDSKRAMLGILLGPNHYEKGGVTLAGITPKSGAAAVGLKAGDRITKIGGIDLTKTDHPHAALSKHMRTVKPGEVVAIEYLRGDKRSKADITTKPKSAHILSMVKSDLDFDIDGDFDSLRGFSSEKVSEAVTVYSDRLLPVAGDLARYFEVDEGVIVLDPPEGSELKAGDVLLAIGDADVVSVSKAAEQLAGLEAATGVRVKRRGRERSVNVGPNEFANAIRKEIRVMRIVDDKKP